MIRVYQVKTENPKQLEEQLLKKLRIPKKDLLSWSVHKKSVDARKRKILFSFVIDAEVKNEKRLLKMKDVVPAPDETFRFEPSGTLPLESRPVVAGFGPAGMFAGLLLAQYGYRPIILERGKEIDARTEDVHAFWKEGKLNPESNVQFGMGGAGAFSDGKLTTRSKDLKSRKVFEELIRFGASPEIAYEQHPHIGTDGFVPILKNLKAYMEEKGAEFRFETRLDDVVIEDGSLKEIVISHDGQTETLPASALILALGHSATDTITMLYEKGMDMENKPFAVGVRIEHLQSFINEAMLKEEKDNPKLAPARYQLTHTADNGKGVYTFCMCPGGYVISAASEPETLVVNGMSFADRANENANAALLVQVDESDTGPGVLDGLTYQHALEKKAFEISKDFKAPVQLAKDYLEHKTSDHFEQVKPTVEPGTVFYDLNDLFSPAVNHALHEALLAFEKKVPGYLDGSLMTGVETRSSSAIRMMRDRETLLSNVEGLYPCGEGSGYAGGIMTSAIDGLRAAMALMDRYEKPDADITE